MHLHSGFVWNTFKYIHNIHNTAILLYFLRHFEVLTLKFSVGFQHKPHFLTFWGMPSHGISEIELAWLNDNLSVLNKILWISIDQHTEHLIQWNKKFIIYIPDIIAAVPLLMLKLGLCHAGCACVCVCVCVCGRFLGQMLKSGMKYFIFRIENCAADIAIQYTI